MTGTADQIRAHALSIDLTEPIPYSARFLPTTVDYWKQRCTDAETSHELTKCEHRCAIQREREKRARWRWIAICSWVAFVILLWSQAVKG